MSFLDYLDWFLAVTFVAVVLLCCASIVGALLQSFFSFYD